MRTLAIETATEACSVALFEDGALLDARHEVLGRGHAERLVPFIAALPGKGQADRIIVSLGPGSFTGVRIGIAAARALGIAWHAEVLGFRTFTLLARMDPQVSGVDPRPCETGGPEPMLVCMSGGHGEWFLQAFGQARHALGTERSMAPQMAVREFTEQVVIGSRAQEFVALRGFGKALDCLPDARFATRLGEDDLFTSVSPVYGRPPDARPALQ